MMIISKLLSRVKGPEAKEDIAGGLAFGLAGGLAFGLAGGLAGGLAFGLAGGLAGGAVTGVFPLTVPVLIVFLIAVEVLYWLGKKPKPAGKNKWWFVAERKAEAAAEVALGAGVYPYIAVAHEQWPTIFPALQTLGWYAFMFLGVVGIAAVWLYINGMKYRNVRKRK